MINLNFRDLVLS